MNVIDSKGQILVSKEIMVRKPITEEVAITGLMFCRTIFQKDPYDIDTQFKIIDNTKIFAHATVNNKRPNTSITYKWFYGGNLIKTSTIKNIVPSTSYRTYEYKTILPHQKDVWKVNVYAEDGTLLKEGSFMVEQ